METTVTKLEMINALGENTSALKESKKDLIEKLFDVQNEAAAQINSLCQNGLIDASEWGITYQEGKLYNYMLYNDEMITKSTGGFDCGDYNYRIAPTNYPKLVEFVLKSADIIKGMQDELQEKIEKINAQL
jgi:hypothetical protein